MSYAPTAPFVDLNTPLSQLIEPLGTVAVDLRTAILREISILSFGADPSGQTDNSAAFAASQASGGIVHFPAGTYRLSRNIGFGCPVHFDSGAIVSVDNGVTLTFDGPLDADAYQIFEFAQVPSAPPVVFGAASPGRSVRPQWWGASVSRDSTAAFVQMFASLPVINGYAFGRVYISSGTWLLTNVSVPSNTGGLIIEGDGGRGGGLGVLGATILSFANGSGYGLTLQGGGITLRDLSITSRGGSTAQAVYVATGTILSKISDVGFFANPAGALLADDLLDDFLLENGYFEGNCSGSSTPVAQIGGNSATTVTVRKCYFSNNNNTSSGVGLSVRCLDLPRIENCAFESSGQLLNVIGGAGARVSSCYFEDAQSYMISANNGYTGGCLDVQDCFFNKSVGVSGAIILSTTESVVLHGNTFSAAFTATTDYFYFDGATLGAVRMLGNSIIPGGDGTFGSLIGLDDDQQLGGMDAFTNLALHSSFEDGSHVTGSGNLTATQDTSGFLGSTSQKLVWTSSATPVAALFANSTQAMAIGDVFTISFYAKANAAVTLNGQWTGAEGLGQFNIRLGTSYRRYVIQSHPAVSGSDSNALTLTPPISTAATVNVDCLMVEKNVRRPHPHVSTTSVAVTTAVATSFPSASSAT